MVYVRRRFWLKENSEFQSMREELAEKIIVWIIEWLIKDLFTY